MTYLMFTVALSLSAIAAWYAVAGLTAIFAAAVIPIAIMGSLLEASKLVVASWLYQNWKKIPLLMKTYFTVALVILMLLTSMGIFGFLSKAHLDQAIPTGDVSAKLALIDEKIKTEKENVNANRKELTQLDAQVDQTISRTTEASGAERAINIRRSQQKDRARILSEIGTAQTKIAKLNEERAPIATEVRKVEAEVGPIKYIAALIYEGETNEDMLEKAVRFVTILIVIVFDPLAVLMLVGANWSLRNKDEEHPKDKLESILNRTKDWIKKPEQVKAVEVNDTLEVKDSKPAFIAETWDDFLNKPIEEPEVIVETNELPTIEVDEHTKEWEPELYAKLEKKDRGRYLEEIDAQPSKTQSFLNKVQAVFKSPDVKTIEKEVEDLQK